MTFGRNIQKSKYCFKVCAFFGDTVYINIRTYHINKLNFIYNGRKTTSWSSVADLVTGKASKKVLL